MMCSNDANNIYMDDFLASPLPFLSDQAMPSGFNVDDLPMIDDLFDDTNHSNAFADNPPANEPNGIQGFDEYPLQLHDINISDLFDSLVILPNNNSAPGNPPPVEETSTKSSVVKSSDTINTTNFINSYMYLLLGQALKLAIPPFQYQRARYEKELKEVLRYIFVLNNAAITLMTSHPPSDIVPQMSFFLRITRLTVPYGSDRLVLCHPYPIWLNDQNGQVHNGSLFLPVTGPKIEIEKLILQRLKQKILKKIKQFSIFMPNQLDFDHFHVINTKKVKDVIGEYNLRYSVLHFQIFCVDQNNNAYPTDMQCQTEPIYEYEGNELDDLPPYVRQTQKKSLKLKAIGQLKKSTTKTKMSKKRKVVERPRPPAQV